MNILDDERSVRDEDFFSQIRLDLPGLESARDAVEAERRRPGEDWTSARRTLACYFLDRRAPRFYLDWRFRTEPVTAFWDRRHTWGTAQLVPVEKRAQALLEDVFVDGHGGRHDISDLEHFPRRLLRNAERPIHITMFIWAADLGEMYARTRDDRYARKLVEIFHRFDQAFPRRVTIHDPNWNCLDRSRVPHWHLMHVGKAARHMTMTLYTGVLHSPEVTPDDVYAFVKKLWFYAAQFTRFTRRGDFEHCNHHWYERGTCPFILGLMFPEFEGFEEMRDWGREVINAHLKRDFFEDGTYFEHSTNYNAGTLGANLLMPWLAAFANDFPLIESDNMSRVRSWLRWVAGMTRPDGVLPAIGDGFDSHPFNPLARGAVLVQDPELKSVALKLQANAEASKEQSRAVGSNRLGIEACLRPAWDHLSVKQSKRSSVVFPDGGWIALRDSWQPDAMVLALSAINPPLGRNHGHWDLLSFTMFARGRSFLSDPASWMYGIRHYEAERRGYLYSMESHNVLTIDDDPLLSKRALSAIWTGDVPKCTMAEWFLGEKVDFVAVYHDGYAPQRHTREVLFVKGDYWLIVDRVSNPDADWVHTYRRLLHFDFDVEVSSLDGRLIAEVGGEAMTIVPFALGEQSLRLWRDEVLEPDRQSLGYRMCPWVAEVRTEAAGPVVLATLFYPHAGADVPDLRLRRLPLTGAQGEIPASEALALEIETPKGRDVWVRSFETVGPVRFGDFETTKPMWLHLDRYGVEAKSMAIETVHREVIH